MLMHSLLVIVITAVLMLRSTVRALRPNFSATAVRGALNSRIMMGTMSTAAADNATPFYLNSPLVPMKNLKNPKFRDNKVLLKLDYLQPSGSFKDRGISNMITSIMKEGKLQRLICSSGGNAGHAVATVGRALGIPVEVYVPTTTKPMMVEKLRAAGASVTIHGANWNEADALAREALESSPGAYYIPPYNDPRIWAGHASIIDELAAAGVQPDTIVLSVGGGGLLAGIQQGLQKHGWVESTRIIAAETEGCASFAAAHRAGETVALPGITSIATSLGALSVLEEVIKSTVRTEPLVVSDAQAVLACRRFADDYNALVEPACGAALAAVYAEDAPFKADAGETIVIIVCGGSVVNAELMTQWCKDFGVDSLYA